VREHVPASAARTLRELHLIVQAAARRRTGRQVCVHLFAPGGGPRLAADDGLVSALPSTVIECRLVTTARVTSCEPLWGPEQGGTTVTLHGHDFDTVGTSARIQFGSSSVPCQRIDSSRLRCRTPPHAAGIIRVVLQHCEDEDATDSNRDAEDEGATFEFVRLEAAYDAIFATTNSFCPMRARNATTREQMHDEQTPDEAIHKP
jgi:hypothetical protein